MPVFISYSHQDKDFVDKLAANLVLHKARVWIDRWELNVGDSLIEKIQEAIQESDALIVIISSSSMKSEWCKKELSAGFLRELEEKRVVVLPLLLENCEMPIFLREKMYADFRSDFDKGLNTILEAIANVTSDTQGRVDKQPEFFFDWSMDWGFTDKDLLCLSLTIVDHGKDIPYVVLTEMNIFANEAATETYKMRARDGKEWLGRLPIVLALGDYAEQNKDLHFFLDDAFPKSHKFRWQDSKLGIGYDVIVTSRWVGEDTGKSVFIDYGNHLIEIKKRLVRNIEEFK